MDALIQIRIHTKMSRIRNTTRKSFQDMPVNLYRKLKGPTSKSVSQASTQSPPLSPTKVRRKVPSPPPPPPSIRAKRAGKENHESDSSSDGQSEQEEDEEVGTYRSQGADPPPHPASFTRGKAGRNLLNEEIKLPPSTPLE
jgi:hypothetical protein